MAGALTIEAGLQQFSESFHRNKARYVGFALTFVRDKSVVEDLVDDSFVKFWENRHNILDVSHLETYFHSIIKNNCRNWIREKQTRLKVEQDIHRTTCRLLEYDLASLEDYDPNLIFSLEIQEILREQLERMPELTRKIFMASRFENLTYAEIAERYGVSVRKVTREIQFALTVLRVSLKDYLPALLVALACLLLLRRLS